MIQSVDQLITLINRIPNSDSELISEASLFGIHIDTDNLTTGGWISYGDRDWWNIPAKVITNSKRKWIEQKSQLISHILELAEKGTFVQQFPTTASQVIPMLCGCGELIHTSVIVKRRAIDESVPRLHCLKCHGSSSHKQIRSKQDARSDLASIHGIIIQTEIENVIGYRDNITVSCKDCNYEWDTTPISLTRCRMSNVVCPKCRDNEQHGEVRASLFEELNKCGVEVLTPGYLGTRHFSNEDGSSNIRVRNNVCGHTFDVRPAYFFRQRQYNCNVCGRLAVIANNHQRTQRLLTEDVEVSTMLQRYRNKIMYRSRRNYAANLQLLNPNNRSLGLAGVDDAYQLDHIVPVRLCFQYNIPIELVADIVNLQVIPWQENISKSDNFDTNLPDWFISELSSFDKVQLGPNLVGTDQYDSAMKLIEHQDIDMLIEQAEQDRHAKWLTYLN